MTSQDESPTVAGLLDTLSAYDIVDLEQPRAAGSPIFPAHRPGFLYLLHRRHEHGDEARTSASGMIMMAEHSGTHIDALCHQAEHGRLYGGVQIEDVERPEGFAQLGIDNVTPMMRRGVLLDVTADDPLPADHEISRADLEECERRQGVIVGAGDVVLVRTGYGRFWGDPSRYERAPGVSAVASQWLADRGVHAVGADNLAWDLPGTVDESTGTTLPGHVILLVRNGIFILENVLLEDLAERAAREFVFVCASLKMRGVTGSPVRPLALIPRRRKG